MRRAAVPAATASPRKPRPRQTRPASADHPQPAPPVRPARWGRLSQLRLHVAAPEAVGAAGAQAIARRRQPWTIAAADFFSGSERARALFARLLGATVEDIAIVPAASYGLAIAAADLPLGPGERVWSWPSSFPPTSTPGTSWPGAAVARSTIERPSDGDWTAAVLAGLDERVRIAALPIVTGSMAACSTLPRSAGDAVRPAALSCSTSPNRLRPAVRSRRGPAGLPGLCRLQAAARPLQPRLSLCRAGASARPAFGAELDRRGRERGLRPSDRLSGAPSAGR